MPTASSAPVRAVWMSASGVSTDAPELDGTFGRTATTLRRPGLGLEFEDGDAQEYAP